MLQIISAMNRSMKATLPVLGMMTVLLACETLKSQQLPIYSQYMMNSYLLNPAVAGHEGYTSLNLTVREQ